MVALAGMAASDMAVVVVDMAAAVVDMAAAVVAIADRTGLDRPIS
jgi:hypothetical protein